MRNIKEKLLWLYSLAMIFVGCSTENETESVAVQSLNISINGAESSTGQPDYDANNSDTWEKRAFLSGDEVVLQSGSSELGRGVYNNEKWSLKGEVRCSQNTPVDVFYNSSNQAIADGNADPLKGEGKLVGFILSSTLSHLRALVEVKTSYEVESVGIIADNQELPLVKGKDSGVWRIILDQGVKYQGLFVVDSEGRKSKDIEVIECVGNTKYKHQISESGDGGINVETNKSDWSFEDPNKVPVLVDVTMGEEIELGTGFHLKPSQTNFGRDMKISCKKYGNNVYITWWKGGLKERNVMLSRYNTVTKQLRTIQFPDKHVGFRGEYLIAEQADPNADLENKKGDPHNSISIGFCKKDGTIHMIYDMHSYKNIDPGLSKHFFNYRVSKPNAVNASDDEFTLDLFNEKQNCLNPSAAVSEYNDVTYPNFMDIGDGDMCVNWRKGGSGTGDDYFVFYNGTTHTWDTKATLVAEGRTSSPEKYSIYGGAQSIDGKICYGFHVRYSRRASLSGARNNEGFHYCETENPFVSDIWYDAFGNEHTFPLKDPREVEFEPEPIELGFGNSISDSPKWTKTSNGTLHFMTNVGAVGNGAFVHCYKSKNEEQFNWGIAPCFGSLQENNGLILATGRKDSSPVIATCPINTNDWTVVKSFTHKTVYFGGPIIDNVLYSVENYPELESNEVKLYLRMYNLIYDK